MAALLPTILSDDECEGVYTNVVSVGDGTFGGKRTKVAASPSSSGGDKTTAARYEDDDDDDDDDDENDDGIDDDEMDEDFEFGGLLGEDGNASDAIGGGFDGSASDVSWSYKSALSLLSRNDSAGGMMGELVERTSVASIIAAARSNLRRGNVGMGSDDDGGDEIDMVGVGKDGMKDGVDHGVDNDDDDDGSSESHSSSSSDDDDDESSDDDGVDDADRATNSMESDSLKVQERRTTATRNKKKDGRGDGGEGTGNNNRRGDRCDSRDDDGSSSSSSSSSSSGEEEDQGEGDGSDSGSEDSYDDGSDDDEERKEAAKAAAFFDASSNVVGSMGGVGDVGGRIDSFSMLGISRPLLRGVASMGFVSPTPIQSSVVPVALAGRDVCASAVTGSGKTAAFLLPIMERILQRGGGRTTLGGGPNNNFRGGKSSSSSSLAATRALILAPTRELAAQCVSMMTAMAKFTDLRAALIVGGAKNVMSQAAELRTRPDVVVATPGRLLDHIANSQGVDMDDVEFLVLDEADRLLDLGFQDEVHEIVKSCPAERQTMLFSATMSTKVDELIRLSLKRPVRISATDKERTGRPAGSGVEVAPRLEQEFVRVRAGNEGVNREGMLLALLTRTFKDRVIVFFDTKSAAHRLMIVCGLCGIKCAELHGNLTQVQRLEALEAFREGSVDVLLCTDLAARGLDISGVEAVINFEMPSQVETYVHRIGRTARAGRGGKSCTLIGEGRRHLMKEVMDAETVARLDRIAEMEAVRVKNIIEHSDSIKSRPQREWFATPKEKMSVKAATAERKRLMEAKVGTGTHRMTRKKRRAQEAREMFLEAKEEATEREEETGKKSRKVFTEAQIKGSARAIKRKEAQRENELAARSLNDDDKRKDRKLKQTRKAANPDAAGDGGLFAEEIIAHAKKPKKETTETPAKSSYTFHEHDPNKKKGKKKAHHAFKSRSKFKRR
ncbi:hypothetical protein ACHAXA_005979 [Cyclostephanos tholiformis]|uniref:RNA helicase n=1 Tax=Cyclostephanos tholiformis TaxID=382380 RepID=A0ABD3SE48_9STRA